MICKCEGSKKAMSFINRINSKASESIVEVIVSATLLSILALFSASLFLNVKKSVVTSGYSIEAKNFARMKLAEINKAAEDGKKLPLEGSSKIYFNDGFPATQTVTYVETTDDEGFDYTKVVVKVDWDE